MMTESSACTEHPYCVRQRGHEGGCSPDHFGPKRAPRRDMDAAQAMAVLTKIWNERTVDLTEAAQTASRVRMSMTRDEHYQDKVDSLETEVRALAYALDMLRREARVYGPMF